MSSFEKSTGGKKEWLEGLEDDPAVFSVVEKLEDMSPEQVKSVKRAIGLLELRRHEESRYRISIDRQYDSVEEYRDALAERGRSISEIAEDMLDALTITRDDKKHLTLVRVQGKDLGFSASYTAEEMFSAAEKRGLQDVPAWGALQLLLDYDESGEEVTIGTKPISAHGHNGSLLFDIGEGNRGGLSLLGYGTDNYWPPSDEWVFVSDE